MDLSFLDAVGGVRVVVGVIVALITIMILKRLMKAGRVENPLMQRVKCGACGWEGSVSKHKPKCPKCANALG
jgi:predicted Zn-ribbon and HTH transcriptional regulator